jgi:hypothetical protein
MPGTKYFLLEVESWTPSSSKNPRKASSGDKQRTSRSEILPRKSNGGQSSSPPPAPTTQKEPTTPAVAASTTALGEQQPQQQQPPPPQSSPSPSPRSPIHFNSSLPAASADLTRSEFTMVDAESSGNPFADSSRRFVAGLGSVPSSVGPSNLSRSLARASVSVPVDVSAPTTPAPLQDHTSSPSSFAETSGSILSKTPADSAAAFLPSFRAAAAAAGRHNRIPNRVASVSRSYTSTATSSGSSSRRRRLSSAFLVGASSDSPAKAPATTSLSQNDGEGGDSADSTRWLRRRAGSVGLGDVAVAETPTGQQHRPGYRTSNSAAVDSLSGSLFRDAESPGPTTGSPGSGGASQFLKKIRSPSGGGSKKS